MLYWMYFKLDLNKNYYIINNTRLKCSIINYLIDLISNLIIFIMVMFLKIRTKRILVKCIKY
jgi:hypothetical protein